MDQKLFYTLGFLISTMLAFSGTAMAQPAMPSPLQLPPDNPYLVPAPIAPTASATPVTHRVAQASPRPAYGGGNDLRSDIDAGRIAPGAVISPTPAPVTTPVVTPMPNPSYNRAYVPDGGEVRPLRLPPRYQNMAPAAGNPSMQQAAPAPTPAAPRPAYGGGNDLRSDLDAGRIGPGASNMNY